MRWMSLCVTCGLVLLDGDATCPKCGYVLAPGRPRGKTRPCAVCGKILAVTASSRPEPVCQPCRRERKGPPKPRWQPQIVTCRCGRDFEQSRYGQLYCRPEHRPDSVHVKVGANLRGYGAAHRQARKRALAAFVEGSACPRCAGPMSAGDALDLDHVDGDKGSYLGLAHASCNRSAGARRGNGVRGVV